jgi:iron complex transport system substrate-binding protein
MIPFFPTRKTGYFNSYQNHSKIMLKKYTSLVLLVFSGNYFRRRCIILFSFLLVIFGCSNTNKSSDSNKNRIISLSPHITEIIYALEGYDDLYAVSDYCRYPLAATKKEKIGGLINPNIEKIVSLKPTIILGVPSHAKLNEELSKFDLEVVMLPNENISDVLLTIDSVGTLIGKANTAKLLIKNIKDSLAVISDGNVTGKPKAMLVIGRERGTIKNITAAGEDTFISEVWNLAGGENLFSDLPTRYSAVNLETILTRNPQVIIEFDIDGAAGIHTNHDQAWGQLVNVAAIKHGHIFTVSGSHTLIPGPRLVVLARQFRKIIDILNSDVSKI